MTYNQPLALIFFLITAAGLVRLRRHNSIRLATVGLLCLFLLSWEPFAWLVSQPLEASYAMQRFPFAPAQAIVVLGSYVDPPKYGRPYFAPDRETYQRCEFAAWLHKNWQPVPVLVCAGLAARDERPVLVMRRLLEQAGVPHDMILSEQRSRNTHENAVYGAEVLRQHGIGTIALVCEAQSMLRAEMCFRKQGIVVVPAPHSFYKLQFTLEYFLPGWKAIMRNEVTLHEVAGLVWYWSRGWV